MKVAQKAAHSKSTEHVTLSAQGRQLLPIKELILDFDEM